MDAPVATALAGLLGSLVGASATIATTWITQRTNSKRELLRAEISKREALYEEFISECSRLLMDAMVRSLDQPERVLPAYALLNRIRLSASDAAAAEAEQMLKRITEQYFAPNLSADEIRALVRSGGGDPLKPFGEACRAELRSMMGAAV